MKIEVTRLCFAEEKEAEIMKSSLLNVNYIAPLLYKVPVTKCSQAAIYTHARAIMDGKVGWATKK